MKGSLKGLVHITLFEIFLEHALKSWKTKCEGMRIPIRNVHIYILTFADDRVVAQDEDDLSYMVRKFEDEYSKTDSNLTSQKQNV